MTLNETLLQKLSEWRPAGEGRHVLATADEHWSVAITADRADSLGCLVWEAALTRKSPAPAGATLRGWADRVARRVTALAEPLAVHEVDESRGEALLRSSPPARRNGQVCYYELHLRGTSSATLRRYQATHETGSHRTQAGFPITHETLARLAGEIAEA